GVTAGIGNEYSDEILFQARMHPKTPVEALSSADLRRVYDLAREVLEAAVAAEADHDRFPASYFLRTRRRSTGCPRCGAAVQMLKVGGRSAYFCPSCQPQR
ncbi:MAG TPA: zinc finger domain-containing protein, partial [Verrucomicrobiae bacterium]|nr:zinc finger domain-containing protein [Verrucomicrobiae bacterium]